MTQDTDATDSTTTRGAAPPDPPEDVAGFIEAAKRYVQRAIGIELDGSATSLAFVDHYVDLTAPEGSPLADEVLALVAPALGAYFGQLVIDQYGGRWVLEESDPRTWRVELLPVELRFYPVGMAAEALLRKDAPGYDASFTTKPAWSRPLAEALSSSAPVERRYYYSLTGRLEILEQAVEILLEFERRVREHRP